MADEERDDAELIVMVNQELGGATTTTVKALREVWGPKGWEEATPEQRQAHDLGLNVFESEATAEPAPPSPPAPPNFPNPLANQ